MNVLLDTHAFLWYLSGDERMSERVLEQGRNSAAKFHLSVASVWEIAIKYHLGKLRLAQRPREFMAEARRNFPFRLLAIEASHVLRSAELDWTHRDPFDRLMVAQAEIEGMAIATADGRIAGSGAETIW